MVDLAFVAERLRNEEAFVSHVYPDSLGIATIGFGRMVDERKGGGITRREAETLLHNDILSCLKDLDRNIKWWRSLPESPQSAVVQMCFQMGWTRLSGFKLMLAALEREDFHEAYKQALDSLWHKQTPKRAKRVAALFLATEPREGR